MDFVYTCRQGDNEELRFSIRSLVKNFKNPSIWLVGYKPSWYTGNFISVEDVGGKFNNIINCIKVISNSKEIEENFVLMNDDFFFVKPLSEILTYHNGSLIDKINKMVLETGHNGYTSLLLKTYKDLRKSGISEPLDYDIHVPMPMTKSGLVKSMPLAFFPRSAYGNIMSVGGEQISSDVKVYNKARESYDYRNGDLPFISTIDESFEKVYDALFKDMFQEPSPYEVM